MYVEVHVHVQWNQTRVDLHIIPIQKALIWICCKNNLDVWQSIHWSPFDLTLVTNFATRVIPSKLARCLIHRKSFMKEGFIKLDWQDKPQKIFYDTQQKANNKRLADMPIIQQRSHEWLGDAHVFVCSFLFQGGILSFENAQGFFFKSFQKLWLESMTACIKSDFIHKLKAYLKAKYWENRMHYLLCYSFGTDATSTV